MNQNYITGKCYPGESRLDPKWVNAKRRFKKFVCAADLYCVSITLSTLLLLTKLGSTPFCVVLHSLTGNVSVEQNIHQETCTAGMLYQKKYLYNDKCVNNVLGEDAG